MTTTTTTTRSDAKERSKNDEFSLSFDSQPFHDDSFRSESPPSPPRTKPPRPKQPKEKSAKFKNKRPESTAQLDSSDDARRLQAALDAVQVLTRPTPSKAAPAGNVDKSKKPGNSNTPRPTAYFKGIARPTDCRAVDDLTAATDCIRRARPGLAFSCDSVAELAIDAHPFAYGKRKIVFRAKWRGVDVIVKRPRKSPVVKEKFSPFDDWRLFRDEAFVFAALVADAADFDADSLLDRGGRMRMAPHFYGMCLEPGRLMTVFERATTLEQYRRTHTLSLTDAVAVAAGIVNVARYLAHPTPLGPLVHCDIHHRQVAFLNAGAGAGDSARPLAVIMDLDELRAAPLAANSTCPSGNSVFQCDKACFKAFHYADFATVNVQLSERVCGADEQCVGYDTSFNSFTFLGYLLWELFLRPSSAKQDLEFVTMIADIVDRARAINPSQRLDVDKAAQRLAQFAKERKLNIGFRPLTAETLRPFTSLAADDQTPTNVHHHVANNGGGDGAERDVDLAPKQNEPISHDLVASMIHLLHPIQVAAAQRGEPLRDRMKAIEEAAHDDSRFVDAEAQKSFIVARIGEQALPTPAPIRKTKPAGTTPAPRALSPQEQREAAQRAQMARIQAAREARDQARAHQLSTGLRLPQAKQFPN
jgi:hypothetical protein